jgi:hypothetical protein
MVSAAISLLCKLMARGLDPVNNGKVTAGSVRPQGP